MPKIAQLPLTWANHVQRWGNCRRCSLCDGRKRVCLARGKIPADVLFVGEAPGECITGDTLIETAYRNKVLYPNGEAVSSLVGRSGFKVYSFDQETRELSLGVVKRVWRTGIKMVYRVSYFWWGGKPDGSGGRHKYFGSICVTTNHPFLLKDGSYMSLQDGLAVGDRLQPFYRRHAKYNFIGISAEELVKEPRFLMADKLGRKICKEEEVHHKDRNKWNDSSDNLALLDQVEHTRLHGLEDNPMFDPKHRQAHKEAMESTEYREKMSNKMKEVLSSPEARKKRRESCQKNAHKTSASLKEKFATDSVYYYRYLKGRKFRDGSKFTDQQIKEKMAAKFPGVEYPPEDNHQIYKVEQVGYKSVYDIEVEKYHNFAANGVFVHNSEDVNGVPFDGPAGQMLDGWVERSNLDQWRCCFTNLTGCIPRDPEDATRKAGEPPDDAIRACLPRLQEIVELCQQRSASCGGLQLVVCVGALASTWVRAKASELGLGDTKIIEVAHPASILRAPEAKKQLMGQKAVVTLARAAQELIPF